MEPSSVLIKEKKESNEIESKDIFKNLKSNYILKKIFNNLKKNKSLNIIKYNNKIKKRLNISIKDYKDYQEYLENKSPIEIEIKPVNNTYGKFISTKKENEMKYIFIYILMMIKKKLKRII